MQIYQDTNNIIHKRIDKEDINVVGLRISKNEFEDITHEGPLMPKHQGAF